MTQLLPPKKEVALALLERSNVDVYLDPRAKGVLVPPQFRKEPRLILKIGLNMPVPIPDLRLDDESLSCTLSFSRSPFYCIVPWPSVFAMVGDDGRGMVWPDDVPQELAVRVEDGKKDESSPVVSEKPSRKKRTPDESRPSLREASEPDRPSRPKRGGQKKKKEERPTPVLVAVPAADRREEKVARKPDAKEREERARPNGNRGPAPTPARPPQPRPAPNPRPGGAGGAGGGGGQGPTSRPKRELPPYLRVVK